jgi:hypothetical protein
MIKADLKAAGIPSDAFDFHCLRHTYATMVDRCGGSHKDTMELARHANANLTFGTYAHTRLENLGRVVNNLPDLRAKPWASDRLCNFAHTPPTPCVSAGLNGTVENRLEMRPDASQAAPLDSGYEYYVFRLGVKHLGHKDAIDMIRAMASGLNPGDDLLTDEHWKKLIMPSTRGQALAMMEAHGRVPSDDPWVPRYQALLERAASIFSTDLDSITPATGRFYLELDHAAGEESKCDMSPFPDEILEGAISWSKSRHALAVRRIFFADYLTRYRTLRFRNPKIQHDEIIKQMMSEP